MGDDSRKSIADTRKSLADPDYTGDDYVLDPAIEKGPLTNRRCTDLLCLFIFLAATGVGGWIGVYSLENGDPSAIMAPMDSNGKFCGRDPGYEDYPYLFISDIAATIWLPYATCVKECPTSANPLYECKGTDNTPANSEGYCTV